MSRNALRRSAGHESHGRFCGLGRMLVPSESSRLLFGGTVDEEGPETEEVLACIVEVPVIERGAVLLSDAVTFALLTGTEAGRVEVEAGEGQGVESCFLGRPRGLLGVSGAASSRIFRGLPLGRLGAVMSTIPERNWPSGAR